MVSISVLVLILCGCTTMVHAHGTCSPKLENINFEDFLGMMLKIKGTQNILFEDLFGMMLKIKGTQNVLFEDLLGMMLKIKGTDHHHGGNKNEVPAFGASSTKDVNLASNEVAKFDKVWTNIGNGYDASSGIFTAPRGGVYQFSCSAMTNSGKTLRLHLMKNDQQTVSLYPGQTGHNMGTLSMVLELKKGDRVYMKHCDTSETSLYSEPGSNFCMFSGYFISQ